MLEKLNVVKSFNGFLFLYLNIWYKSANYGYQIIFS